MTLTFARPALRGRPRFFVCAEVFGHPIALIEKMLRGCIGQSRTDLQGGHLNHDGALNNEGSKAMRSANQRNGTGTMRSRQLGLGAAMLLACAGSAHGQFNHFWQPSGALFWTSPGNWSPSFLPGTSSIVKIESPSFPQTCILSGASSQVAAVNVGGVNGLLRTEGAGSLIADQIILGLQSSDMGSAIVSGPGSSWSAGPLFDAMFVGFHGTGSLLVEQGSQVNATGNLRVANHPGSSGEVVVTGAGTLVEVEQVSDPGGDFGGALNVGRDGQGSMQVLNGANVFAHNVLLGGGSDGNGEILVSGAGSLLQTTGAPTNSHIIIGFFGEGLMTVADGGTVIDAGRSWLADQPSGSGRLLVTGAGSSWNCFGDRMTAAFAGDGVIIARNGGRISVRNGDAPLRLTALASSTGTLCIGAEADSPAQGPGVLDISQITSLNGAGHLVFNHTGEYNLRNLDLEPIAVEGPVSILKAGPGTSIIRHGANSFTGDITIREGVLRAVADGSLGNAGNVVTLRTGGVLMNQEQDLTLPANRTIHLAQGQGRLRSGWERTFTINGPITGPGDLTIANDSGVVEIAGAAKTYGGATVIGRDADNGGNGPGATMRLGSGEVLPGSTHLRFNPGTNGVGRLELNGHTQTVGSIARRSGIGMVNGPGVLTVTGDPVGTDAAGQIRIQNGATLHLDDAISTQVDFICNNGATLAGYGGAAFVQFNSGSTGIPDQILTLNGQRWGGGSTLVWNLRDASFPPTDGIGQGWGGVAGFGPVMINATPSNPMTIQLHTLDSNGQPGPALGFDPQQPFSWAVMSHVLIFGTGVVNGFHPDAFVLDDSGFVGANGSFSVRSDDGHVFIDYTPGGPSGCPADLNTASASNPSAPGWGVPDGQITPADFTAFVSFFQSGDLRADLNTATAGNPAAPGWGVPDGVISPADFTAFVYFFQQGCD